jgi:DNA adenine methylase
MSVPSPLNWFGGKTKLSAKIVQHFPPHRTYCEPFGGSAAVLLAKEPAKVEVYNDIDRELVNFFQVLRDAKLCAKLHAAAENTLYARAEFELAKQSSDDPVEAARRFVVRHRMSFGGKGDDWCYSIGNSRRGTAAAIRRWRWGIESLLAVHERFKDVQIECAEWRNVVARFDSPDTLFFCDPPYVPETRVAGTYRHELTQDDHRQLVACLLSIRGMVVLSGYAHKTYKALERAGWARIDYRTCTHVRGSLTRRVESVWLSPSVVRNGQSRNLFLSPAQRMSQGAHHTHNVMVAATAKKLTRAIERLRTNGKKPTATRLARATGMRREHISRKYRHLFEAEKV